MTNDVTIMWDNSTWKIPFLIRSQVWLIVSWEYHSCTSELGVCTMHKHKWWDKNAPSATEAETDANPEKYKVEYSFAAHMMSFKINVFVCFCRQNIPCCCMLIEKDSVQVFHYSQIMRSHVQVAPNLIKLSDFSKKYWIFFTLFYLIWIFKKMEALGPLYPMREGKA